MGGIHPIFQFPCHLTPNLDEHTVIFSTNPLGTTHAALYSTQMTLDWNGIQLWLSAIVRSSPILTSYNAILPAWVPVADGGETEF